MEPPDFHYRPVRLTVPSRQLKHDVTVSVLLPPGYHASRAFYPVLFLNDGQDLGKLHLATILGSMYANHRLHRLIVAGVHAGDRLHEYGSSVRRDYLGRGSRAPAYARFVVRELWPVLRAAFRCRPGSGHAFAGFSLGGLSAFDVVWHHPELFSKAGVFSGSLWWRSRKLGPGYSDARDRIVIRSVGRSRKREGLRFWLQAGTRDEIHDRNGNGVIDAIDDTRDLVAALKKIGYTGREVRYCEVEGGRHDFDTWRYIMPEFLLWAFGVRG